MVRQSTITTVRIFFSAGEASGDAYGAALLNAIRSLAEEKLDVTALGGRKLAEAGAWLIADSSSWGAIGIAESLKVYPKARMGLAKARRALASGKPGVFVPIDYGYLNIGLARYAKERGWKVVYFSPPGAWRKDKQGADLPKVTDAIITPFSWSAEILHRMGGNAHWFGHPIKEMIRESDARYVMRDGERGRGSEGQRVRGLEEQRNRGTEERRDEERFTVAVLPGSRTSEIKLLLPVFARAVKGLSLQAEIAVAPSLDVGQVKAIWEKWAPGRSDLFTVGDTYGVLRRAKAAIVCSGTATLEAALCRCPHLVAYKVSPMVELQARLIRFKVRHIAMPNILLDRDVVPELIQHAATWQEVGAQLRVLLTQEEVRRKQLDAFEELDALLGPDDAISRSAELIAGFLQPGAPID